MSIQRVSIIGNAGAGKTTLSRHVARIHSLPLTHVDSIQFLPGMRIRPHAESIATLRGIQSRESWLIEGYGPLDILEERLQRSQIIVFIDFPLWRHYYWGLKRQVLNLWHPREELPVGCSEANWGQTLKLLKTIRRAHQQMRPELLRILARDHYKEKVLLVRTLQDWQRLANQGVTRSDKI